VDEISVEQLLAPDGPVARHLGDGFEHRPEQTQMAEAVERCFEDAGRLLVEAGTGVGKSFAYLAPAMLRAIRQNERVVVATNTISLQEQLLEKDVPALRSALGLSESDLRVVLVKGRGNYISIRRLELASKKQANYFPDAASRRTLQAIEDWAYQTRDGTLATLPQLERPGVWDRVQSDSGNCMGRRCPRYEQCFYQNARRDMERGDILICNHALFFSDLALRTRDVGFLPPYDHVILDEAHCVEDVASEHFGVSLSEGRVQHLLSMLHQPRTGKGFLSGLPTRDGESRPVVQAFGAVHDAAAAADHFFDALVRRTERRGQSGVPKAATTRIHETGIVENTVTPAFKELSLRLKRLKEIVDRDEDRYELNSYSERAQLIAMETELLVDQEVDGCAYWVEITDGARGRRVTFACSPIEVAPILREKLFGADFSVTLTSATLTTARDSFDHTQTRLGCDDAETLALGSPFDHASQVQLYVDASMPDPRSRDYLEGLAERVRTHIAATDGGAFVLFTSFATMNAIAKRLRPWLAEQGHPLRVQGVDGARSQILREFCEDRRSVLFGVSSFWQGVDVRGDALRNVIITRLPFEPPDRPLTEARLERIREQGGDPFRDDSLPRAVIRFKQGFGRLIRSASDEGRVVVLDPRIVSRGYGRLFLAALPEGVDVRPVEEEPSM